MRKVDWLLVAVLGSTLSLGSPLNRAVASSTAGSNPSASLYEQAAASRLDSDFQSPNVSFLLLDAGAGTLLASHWENSEQPIPLGSLIKPFVALAYGQAHQFRYPIHICYGEASGCWLPRGHGATGMASAIANSCNSYFRALTTNMTSADVIPTAARFGLDSPSPELAGPELIGMENRWLISPMHMARAYLELNRRRDLPGMREIVTGMAESGRGGTGSAVDRALRGSAALVKTGTAACTHSAHAPGDGFAVVLIPAERPEVLLMVRVHGVPGARAAATAGEMLARIEE